MSGLRQVRDIFGLELQSIEIPSSEIQPNRPLNVTVFPIGLSQGVPASLDPKLRLEGNAPGLPLPSPNNPNDFRDNNGTGFRETITYNPSVSNISYKALVKRFLNTTGRYLLEVSSEDGNNNASNTAVFIGNVSDNPSVNGFVGRSDTDDWFNFRVPSDGEVRITLDVTDDNAQLDIFKIQNRAQGNQIDTAQAEIGSSGLITRNLTAGNYFAKVTPANNSTNLSDGGPASTEYILTIDPVTGTPDTTPDSGVSSQDALRFWDFTSESHIFTSDQFEIDNLTGQSNLFRREGNEFDVPVNNGDPVFRYRNTATGSDFLSFESGIENSLPQFRNIGVAFNAYKPIDTTEQKPADAPANAIPIYRLANLDAEQANPLNITHFYTADPFNRQRVLDTLNYRDEFVGFWALPATTDGLVS